MIWHFIQRLLSKFKNRCNYFWHYNLYLENQFWMYYKSLGYDSGYCNNKNLYGHVQKVCFFRIMTWSFINLDSIQFKDVIFYLCLYLLIAYLTFFEMFCVKIKNSLCILPSSTWYLYNLVCWPIQNNILNAHLFCIRW